MAALTLLDMVQSILNDMDSDAVNSISDTVEAMQVASIVRDTYLAFAASRDWPWLESLTNLTGLGDTSNPTQMRMPTSVDKLKWVKYNKKDVTYLPPKDFKDLIDRRDTTASNVNAGGYVTDRDPLYWTSYDDDYVWFDSYDSSVDSTLQESKSTVFAVLSPSWTHSDAFVPQLPVKLFPTLLSDAKSTAFLTLKQSANPKEEQKARRGTTRAIAESWRVEKGEWGYGRNINYGRK